MLVLASRLTVGVVGVALLVLAVLAGNYGVWLLTTDDPDGGAHFVGLFVLPGSVLLGIVGLGLLNLVIRR